MARPQIEQLQSVSSRMIARGLIIIAAVLLTVNIVRIDFARWLELRDPALGHLIAPGDARLNAALAAHRLRDHPTAPDRAGQDLTRQALAREAGLVPAIELAALAADRAGDSGQAGRLMTVADRLSRRSLPTQLWLIEHAATGNRPTDALRHYATALATMPDASAVLFAPLSRALAAPELMLPIARMTARGHEWGGGFMAYAIDHATPEAAFELVMRQPDRTTLRNAGLDQRLTARLLTTLRFDLARRVEQTFSPCATCSGLVHDARFWPATARYPFGWDLVENGTISAVRQREGEQGQLRIDASPMRNGSVARQLVMLEPGRYTLASAWAPGPRAEALWHLACATSGADVARLTMPMTGALDGQVIFDVPAAGCPAQWLSLEILPSRHAAAQAGTLTYVRLASIR